MDGQRQGEGTATYADGTVYEGSFVDGQRDGQGKITMADGFTLCRPWKAGEIDGKGVATYADGDVYEGRFVAGKRQGEGVMRYATGQETGGTWTDGALTAPAPAGRGCAGTEATRGQLTRAKAPRRILRGDLADRNDIRCAESRSDRLARVEPGEKRSGVAQHLARWFRPSGPRSGTSAPCAGCAPKRGAVAVQEVPVEQVERAGARAASCPSRRRRSRRSSPTSGRCRRPTTT